MSLSGLDLPAVDNAYKSVLERGGWFLLNYTSRDSVDVLAHGVKGIAELREASEAHFGNSSKTAPNPLFGMIHFRRRKILIKLVLEGTSRLIQARVQVHWASITSKFSDHESIFEPSGCDQLTETALTAHIELHSSRSSSGSTKKPALDGIAEGSEETASERRESNADKEQNAGSGGTTEPLPKPMPLATPQAPTVENVEPKRPVSQRSTAHKLNDPKPSFDNFDPNLLEPRRSSQSVRPTTADLLGSSLYGSFLYKPKIKLGPRPSTSKPSGSQGQSAGVASLPAGMRTSRIGPPSKQRSRDSTAYSAMRLPPPPPIPESPMIDITQRPKSSSASVKSLPATLPKPIGMTPEKQRLMKFRDMYKRRESKGDSKKPVMTKSKAPLEEPAIVTENLENVAVDEHTGAVMVAVAVAPSKPDEQHTQMVEQKDEDANNASNCAEHWPLTDEIKDLEAKAEQLETLNDHNNSDSGVGLDAQEEELYEDKSHKPEPDLCPVKNTPLQQEDVSPKHLNSTHVAPLGPDKPTLTSAGLNPSSPPGSLHESFGHPSTRPTSLSEASEKLKSTADECEALNGESAASIDVSQVGDSGHETLDKVKFTLEVLPSEIDSASLKEKAKDFPDVTRGDGPAQESRSNSASTEISQAAEKRKRLGLTAPITLDVSPATSDVEYDDDLMEELQEATVQQATPISVSKSPITPVFPRRPSVTTERSMDSLSKTGPTLERFVNRRPSAPNNFPVLRPVSKQPNPPVPDVSDDKVSVPKNIKIGGGIAAKIADLQRNFSRSSSAGSAPAATTTSKTPPEGVRKSFVSERAFALQSSPSSNRGASVPRPTSKTSQKGNASPESVHSSTFLSQRPYHRSNENQPPIPTQPPLNSLPKPSKKSNSDSISVTATIIRHDKTLKPDLVPPNETTPLELHASPIVINHHERTPARPIKPSIVTSSPSTVPSATPSPQPPLTAPHSSSTFSFRSSSRRHGLRSASISSLRSTPASPISPAVPDSSPGMPRRSMDVSSTRTGIIGTPEGRTGSMWRTFSTRRKSESRSPTSPRVRSSHGGSGSGSGFPGFLPRSMSSTSLDTTVSGESAYAGGEGRSKSDGGVSASGAKKGSGSSRTSRLMRRMSSSISSIAGSGRMHLGTLSEKGGPAEEFGVINEPILEQKRPGHVEIGVCEVQFPDTLLWKHRIVEIDDAGYLVLKPAGGNERMNGIVKKFHLNEFNPPFMPDHERQEMPNSIILDFRDGRTLQCACQNGPAQRHVLQVLLESHSAWIS